MQATKQLQDEHQGIKVGLKILGKLADKLAGGESVDITHLERLLDFLKTFADRCHHSKEEDALFPAMEKAGIPREGGPIGMMLMEHDTGRQYVKGMIAGLEKYRQGDRGAAREITNNAAGYINLLSEHIDKEDNILYPIADMHLSDDEQKNLFEEFEKIERDKIGAGRHEEYHGMLQSLKSIYLP